MTEVEAGVSRMRQQAKENGRLDATPTLADIAGPLDQGQAMRILAIFNRCLHADDARHAETSDAA